MFAFQTFSQEEEKETKTLENQFDKIYRTSTSYQVYKVISKEGFLNLKKEVLDSLSAAKSIIKSKNLQLATQEETITTLTENADSTKLKLEDAISKEESISLFGLYLNKTTYNIILWSLIAILIVGMIFYLFKYKNSHVYTKEAQERLHEVEEEFEEFRKKTLVKEQKLRRQLQDEINKQK